MRHVVRRQGGIALDTGQAEKHYRSACLALDVIDEASPDEVGNRPDAIRELVLGKLVSALKCDPGHLAAREMAVRMIADELGAYAEACPEADELVRRSPDNPTYRELRERVHRRAGQALPEQRSLP